mgnify:CR=1 FL=1
MQDSVREFLQTKFAEAIVREDNFRGDQTFYIKPTFLSPICEALQDSAALRVDPIELPPFAAGGERGSRREGGRTLGALQESAHDLAAGAIAPARTWRAPVGAFSPAAERICRLASSHVH